LRLERCTQLANFPLREQAWGEQKIMGLPNLKAGVLVIYSCSVIRTGKPTFVAQATNFGHLLSANATYGACIVTWKQEQSLGDGSELNALLNDVASGLEVGKALGKFNRSNVAKLIGTRLCLLGDPLYCLRPSLSAATLPCQSRLSTYGRQRAADVQWFIEIAQRRHLINEHLSLGSIVSLDVSEAHSVLDKLLVEAARGEVGEGRLRAARLQANEHAARISAASESAEETILSFYSLAGTKSDMPCCVCGEPTYASRFAPNTWVVSDWTRTECAACGTKRTGVASSPDLKISRSGDGWVLSLTDYPTEARAAVRIFEVGYSSLFRPLIAEKTWFSWPVDANGELEREFVISECGFSSPARCHTSLVWSAGHSFYVTEMC
jgi:hypothetical protein